MISCAAKAMAVPQSQLCDNKVGDVINLYGICVDDPYGWTGQDVCDGLTDPGEWKAIWALDVSGLCNYYLTCNRQEFHGDPATCCLNGYGCNGGPISACFTDQGHKTCDPVYRRANSGGVGHPRGCRNVLLPYCAGADLEPGDVSWTERWISNSPDAPTGCLAALRINTFTISQSNLEPGLAGAGLGGSKPIFPKDNLQDVPTPCLVGPPPFPGCTAVSLGDNSLPASSEGFRWAQQVVEAALSRYIADGYVLGSLPGTPGYHPFQDILYQNVCCPYPGLCNNALKTACSQATAQRLALNPALADICGCHLPAGEYQTYAERYQVNPECTPMCNRPSVVPRTMGDGNPAVCEQTVCLIDDVTINLAKTQAGGITIAQMCGNCGGASTPGQNPLNTRTNCSCIIEGTTIDVVDQITGGVAIKQGCGAPVCTARNTNPLIGPPIITVPCANPANPFGGGTVVQEVNQRDTNVITLFVIMGVLFLTFLIVLFLAPRKKK